MMTLSKTSRISIAILVVFLALATARGSSSVANDLSPFTSDGCSAFPDGTLSFRTQWLSCCTAHDIAYWRGGTYQERLTADKELRQCVAQTGQDEIAKIMLAGVRVGGTPYLPTTFRWGYGWPYLRGYKPLSDSELAQVEAQLKALETE